MDYCTSCFAKESPSSESDASGASRRGLCRRCRIFNMQPLDKKLLMGLRVKDLRWYLTKKRVSAHLCKVCLVYYYSSRLTHDFIA